MHWLNPRAARPPIHVKAQPQEKKNTGYRENTKSDNVGVENEFFPRTHCRFSSYFPFHTGCRFSMNA